MIGPYSSVLGDFTTSASAHAYGRPVGSSQSNSTLMNLMFDSRLGLIRSVIACTHSETGCVSMTLRMLSVLRRGRAQRGR